MEQQNKYRVIVSARAAQMLVSHAAFLAQVNPAAAERLTVEFEKAAKSLEQMPQRCPWLKGEYIPKNAYRFILFEKRYLLIPLSYFSHLLADYFDGQEVTAYEKKLLGGISKVPVTPIMEQILAETSRFTQYRGGLGYLYLDGKLLELLSIYLGEVLELDILMGKNISMSKTERTAIMEAKRIIDSQLAFAPSCEELSRLVHLSVTKLTRGFSSFYGMPIHQYIIEQRLTQAAQLLLEGDWNVSEIAAIVGYGKPSNFAAAFKKRYGVAPKNYRESYLDDTKK